MRKKLDLSRWEQLPDATELTIAEVAEILRLSQSQVRNAIHEGRLEAQLFSGRGKGTYRIEKRAVVAYKRASRFQPKDIRREHNAARRTQEVRVKHLDEARLRAAWLDAGAGSGQPDERSAAQRHG
jgi:excisionase family DNA binding protein